MSGNELEFVTEHLREHRAALDYFIAGEGLQPVKEAAQLCVSSLKKGGKILLIGNGGSAADSQHIAAELVGRYLQERKGIAAIALTVNTSVLTAVSNDYSFEEVFSRQIEAIGKQGDVVLGISTSGKSGNVIKGLKTAKDMGLSTVGFTGSFVKGMANFCDTILAIPSEFTPAIQEMHILAGHILCGIIERELLL